MPPTSDNSDGDFVVVVGGHGFRIHLAIILVRPLQGLSSSKQVLVLVLKPKPQAALQELNLLHALQVPPLGSKVTGHSSSSHFSA